MADDYVEGVLFSMNLAWDDRFLLRDHMQFSNDPNALRLDPDMAADLEGLHELLLRMRREGMLRRDLRVDLRVARLTAPLPRGSPRTEPSRIGESLSRRYRVRIRVTAHRGATNLE